MAFPVRDTAFTAHHLVAALAASTPLRLSVMGKLTTFQQSANGSGRKLAPAEVLGLLNELAFTVEVGVLAASEGSELFEETLHRLLKLQMEEAPLEHEVTMAARRTTALRDSLGRREVLEHDEPELGEEPSTMEVHTIGGQSFSVKV